MNPDAEWQLDTTHIGRCVHVYNRLESTNASAAALAADPTRAGLVILAREQTAGRGQHGRQWDCPPNVGVLLSVLLFPLPVLRRPAVLTAWAAVSVCEAILNITGLQAKIKWPNDVFVQGRKVCGILIEQGRATVAGIGLNVNQSAEMFAAAGLPLATSLRVLTNQARDCDGVAKQVIAQLDEQYEGLYKGDWNTLEACWKWRVGLLGRQVVIEATDRTVEGRLMEMTFDGLELESTDGSKVYLRPEAIKHINGK